MHPFCAAVLTIGGFVLALVRMTHLARAYLTDADTPVLVEVAWFAAAAGLIVGALVIATT